MEADIIALTSALTGMRIAVQSPIAQRVAVVSWFAQRLEVASPVAQAIRVASTVELEEMQP